VKRFSRFIGCYLFVPVAFFSIFCAISADVPEAEANEQPAVPFLGTTVLKNRIFLPEIPSFLNLKIKIKAARVRSTKLKGWNYVFSRLVKEGVDPIYLSHVFSDPRMPHRDDLYFSIKPREPKNIYRRVNTRKQRKIALKFYVEHAPVFELASAKYGIPQSVILAILQVETKCGAFTGRSRIFHRLARLSSANSPDNIERNIKQKLRDKKESDVHYLVQKRGKWLEQEFLPHTIAALVLADYMSVHPLDLKGSTSGAIGLPQFLPGNVFRYGVDADRNGKVDLLSPPDAILSVANYLQSHGWHQLNIPRNEQRAVIWNYNHSKPYVDTVLAMAKALDKEIIKIRHKIPKVDVITSYPSSNKSNS